MRGDSLRDLYAKTLALVGLGVLAGTGALVDYWPSGVALPAVDAGLVQPSLAASLPVPSTQPDLVRMASVRPHPVLPVVLVEAAVAEQPAPRTPDLALTRAHEGFVRVAALSPPPAAMPVHVFAAMDEYPLGEEVALTEPSDWPVTTLALSTPAVAMSTDDDHDGVFTGLVKRTGTSIVRTGRKTGASILVAFRVVSGAVRRALPN